MQAQALQEKEAEHLRGRRIISADEAARRADRMRPLDDMGLTWGGLVLPSEEASTHFCVVGATGSGKTMLLRLLMQSCLRLIGHEFKYKVYHEEQMVVVPPPDDELQEYNDAESARTSVTLENRVIKKQNKDIQTKNEETKYLILLKILISMRLLNYGIKVT